METIASLIVFALLLLSSSLKFVIEHERYVVFRYGRLKGIKGPGPIFVIPLIETFKKVEMRTVSVDMPEQDLFTSDRKKFLITPTCFLQVVDAEKVVTEVSDPYAATEQVLQATLRKLCADRTSTELLGQREAICKALATAVDAQTQRWGINTKEIVFRNIEAVPEALKASQDKSVEKAIANFAANQAASTAVAPKTVAAIAAAPQTSPAAPTAASNAGANATAKAASNAGANATAKAATAQASSVTAAPTTKPQAAAQAPAASAKPSAAAANPNSQGTPPPLPATSPVAPAAAQAAVASPSAASLNDIYPERDSFGKPTGKTENGPATGEDPEKPQGVPMPEFASLQLDIKNDDFDLFMTSLAADEAKAAPAPQAAAKTVEKPATPAKLEQSAKETAAAVLPETLRPALTGTVTEKTCRHCNKPLEGGLLCFQCWEMN